MGISHLNAGFTQDTTMRILFCGIVLLSSVLVAIFAREFDDDFGTSDFDSDWLWVGSNLRSVGRPKFKITEHPDGYSMQLGYSGHYMRIRYTDSDNSIDFNIMDYKGSFKHESIFQQQYGGPDFEGTFEVTGDNSVDAKIKLKHSRVKTGQYRSRLDPHDIEVSFVNKYREGGSRDHNRISMPSMRMRDAKQLDALFKITINPRNWAESAFSFHLNAKGDIFRSTSGSYWNDDNWLPGNYNLSASLMVINFVEPNPSQRQPKMTMALDLEEEVTFDEQAQDVPNVPRDQKLLKKSVVLEGMINLTGKGDRLGVLKLTDADTGKSIGRIQARRADEENLRLEIFADGKEYGALNLYQSPTGMTNVTVEDIPDYCESDPNEYSNEETYEYEGTNGTDFNTTDYILTNLTDDTTDCRNINRLLEQVVGDGISETRFYKDAFLIGVSADHRKRRTEGDKGLIMEEKMSAKDGKYEESIMFASGWGTTTLYSTLNNEGEDTNFQLGLMTMYRNWRTGELKVDTDKKIDMEIKPRKTTNEEDEFNFKLSYNNGRLFDGWFYLTELIRRYARERFPAMVERQLATLKDSHDEMLKTFSEYV